MESSTDHQILSMNNLNEPPNAAGHSNRPNTTNKNDDGGGGGNERTTTFNFIKQATQVTSGIKLIKLDLNREYLISLKGILRILIILFQFGGWVSLLSIVKAEYLRMFNFNGSAIAYLVFSMSGFLISILIYLVYLLDLARKGPKILISLLDAAFIVPMIILGIFCAINETYYNDPKYESFARVVLNRGAAASAGFFGCSLGLLYFASTIINFKM